MIEIKRYVFLTKSVRPELSVIEDQGLIFIIEVNYDNGSDYSNSWEVEYYQ